MPDQQLIIGLGTERCGTVSLASFLDDQPGTRVIHEGALQEERHLFNWDVNSDKVVAYLEQLEQRLGTRRFGDVAFYFLPHAEAIVKRWPNAKFVVLQRPRSETVESYMRYTSDRNHWMSHDGSKWEHDPTWDPKFPTLDAHSKEAAVAKYWDLYYRRIDALIEMHPDAFSLYAMRDLNKREKRKKILAFLEYKTEEMVLSNNYRENAKSNHEKDRIEKHSLCAYVRRMVVNMMP